MASRCEPIRPTLKIMLEIIEHEAIVCESYRDSEGVWTWGIGVTDASGHRVGRYRRKPTTIRRCLEVYEWLIRTKYLPEVLEAAGGTKLTEEQLGAALSFHWNTGSIHEADWFQSFKRGDRDRAFRAFMNWSKPREIIGRRKLERELFFNGRWSHDGRATHYQRVSLSASAHPIWSSARQVDIREDLAAVMAEVDAEHGA